MVQKLSVKGVALAFAIVWAGWYAACALLFLVAPSFALSLVNYFFHGIDLTIIAKTGMDIGSVVIGLVVSVIFAYASGAVFAALYNKLSK